MPVVGEHFAIGATLEDQSDSKFVRAILIDADNNPLPYSPLGLPNRGSGIYLENTKTFPDTDYVMIVYEVYDDSLYTKKSNRYWVESETLYREVKPINSIDYQKIISDVSQHMTEQINRLVTEDVQATVYQDQEISVTLIQNEVTVVADDNDPILVKIESPEVSAKESGDSTVKVTISQDEIDAEVSDC